MFKEDIALAVLKAHHERHIKVGDYYTYDEAAKLIMGMKKQRRTKEKVLEVLRFIEVSSSFFNALQAIKNDAESVPKPYRGANSKVSFDILKDKFNEFIREHLCKSGINPILLPGDSDTPFLPNTSAKLFTV
ncbi:hypothetical protein QNH47_12080 [Virgibacillus halodenitrificans]|uniref:hypothetical protein n=1 Tax=Virgibacillus halodenitrificans TaxID=1482 RepID=UPI0024C04EA1|nr:hypothetical protein [Virgibacillus halodenitrificans]WHX24922.1 hypothetical protein QNH47_12080 [Virgibacillus halodenitrificans]